MDFPNGKGVMNSSTNNAILPFANVTDARQMIKTQFAHLFAEMLRQKSNPVISDIRDVLSEIKTLRHELIKEPTSKANLAFLQILRMLLKDQFNWERTEPPY